MTPPTCFGMKNIALVRGIGGEGYGRYNQPFSPRSHLYNLRRRKINGEKRAKNVGEG